MCVYVWLYVCVSLSLSDIADALDRAGCEFVPTYALQIHVFFFSFPACTCPFGDPVPYCKCVMLHLPLSLQQP